MTLPMVPITGIGPPPCAESGKGSGWCQGRISKEYFPDSCCCSCWSPPSPRYFPSWREAVRILENASKFFAVMTMAAVGMNSDLVKLMKTGGKLMFLDVQRLRGTW